MTDYSVAQFEAQRLEIACLKREVEEQQAEIARLTAAWREEQRREAEARVEVERLRSELDFLHTKQDAGVKALREAVEGGRAAAAVVTIPIWLDELRWAIVEELDSRDELIRAQAAGGDGETGNAT